MMEDLVSSVVIDNGSGQIKCGLSSDEQPMTVPSIIGRPKVPKIIVNSESQDVYVGKSMEDMRGILSLSYPIEHGIVTNWDDMEKIWAHVYYDVLKKAPEKYPVTVTEAPLNPKQHRRKLAEKFFENFGVPSLYIGTQAVLSLYAAGRVNGMVVDSGDGVTHVVPIYEGYVLPHAIMRMNIAGRDLTKYMSRLLTMNGLSFSSSSEFEIVREIKEKVCYVAADYDKEYKEYIESKDIMKKHILPDGSEINVDFARFQCPEALFNPHLLGLEADGLSQIVLKAISECDMDVRKTLYGNIVLSGGTTMFPNIQTRLHSEIVKLMKTKNITPKIEALPERKYLVWLGATILSNLPQFGKELSVSQQEYVEHGPNIVLNKFF